jgi:hypothetical protein
MMRELNNRLFLMVGLLAVVALISGCSGASTNVSQKYYTGYNSLEMSFLSDSPPTTFYYDGEATAGSQVNMIPINVQIQNKGSSDSYGAIFVHGFDPNIVSVKTSGSSTGSSNGFTYGSSSTSAFSGWVSGQNYAFNILGVDVGSTTLNFGLANVNGRQTISFSTFGGSVKSRSELFSSMGYTSASIASARIGGLLNPITKSMFGVYGWSNTIQNIALEGKSQDNPSGGMEVLDFPATILTLPPSLEQFTQRIMITSCFDYATHASAMVCIDPEPYSNVRKACTANTVSLSGGQGAPVSVTSIEQRPARGRTTFTINVKLTKTGTDDILYDYFSLYKCDPASGQIVKTNDKNVVSVGYIHISNEDITMSCTPDQTIRLDESGNGQIVCSMEFPTGMATSAFQSPMEIELWYGYSKTIYRDVYVRKI